MPRWARQNVLPFIASSIDSTGIVAAERPPESQ
jgi:hypothetical protein